MVVSYARPVDKGVTRLMYVGDDLQPGTKLTLPFLIALGVVAYLALVYDKR